MTACGRRGKPKAGFPRASTVLGNRKPRDSHISTAAARRGKVENQKQVSHFPACCFFFPQNESERRPGGGSLRSRLQAHSWIRKCCKYRKHQRRSVQIVNFSYAFQFWNFGHLPSFWPLIPAAHMINLNGDDHPGTGA